jgi:hypothetical protein
MRCLRRFRNDCDLIKVARGGFLWEKTTKGFFASAYTHREIAIALLLLLAPWPAICQMNTGCPWLNVATATGVLKSSEHSPMAILAEGGKPACDFTYHDATASRELKITVDEIQDAQQAMTAYKARCGSAATPLRGIGNEAVICAVESKGKSHGQQVIGIVRDQIFTVTVITNAKNDPVMPQDALEEKSRNISEQVAGALF